MIYKKISGFSDEISEKITEQFEALNRMGIKWFEPRGIDGINISNLDDKKRDELLEKMKEYGISVSSIGSPVGKIKLEDDFLGHFELFKEVVKTAKFLGSKYIRVFSFYHNGADEWSADERVEVLKRLSLMIDYAKDNDVVLLHENEKDIYGDTIERCLDLMENLYCENFRAVFDPANFVQCGQNTLEAYEKLNQYIEYMHIKDADGDGNVVPVGYGEGNVEKILKSLTENGYNGFLSLEPHLGSFSGFEALETDDKMTKLEKSSEEKFVIAYDALKKVLERI